MAGWVPRLALGRGTRREGEGRRREGGTVAVGITASTVLCGRAGGSWWVGTSQEA